MNLVKNAVIVGLIIMLAMLASCEYENPVIPQGELPEVVSYSNDIQPYFDKSCNMSGCHTSFGIPPALNAEKSYDALLSGGFVDVNEPEKSRLYVSIASGSMEQYSTAQENALVLKWIEQGAENN